MRKALTSMITMTTMTAMTMRTHLIVRIRTATASGALGDNNLVSDVVTRSVGWKITHLVGLSWMVRPYETLPLRREVRQHQFEPEPCPVQLGLGNSAEIGPMKEQNHS